MFSQEALFYKNKQESKQPHSDDLLNQVVRVRIANTSFFLVAIVAFAIFAVGIRLLLIKAVQNYEGSSKPRFKRFETAKRLRNFMN